LAAGDRKSDAELRIRVARVIVIVARVRIGVYPARTLSCAETGREPWRYPAELRAFPLDQATA
jgi:hypothetical protein